MKLERLDHIGIFVTDLARARRFYEGILGMSLVDEDEDEDFRMMTLAAADHEVHLFQRKSSETRPHINHVSYRVAPAEFEPCLARLSEQGIAYGGPWSYRNTRFVKLKDPDGSEIELIAEA